MVATVMQTGTINMVISLIIKILILKNIMNLGLEGGQIIIYSI